MMTLQAITAIGDPATFDEAAAYEYWRQAMKAGIESIEKNQTWELVDHLKA